MDRQLKFLAIIFLFWGPVLTFPQNPHPHFRNYTTEDGLPSPEVHYCLEDPNGYMWFATDNGLSRFDGYTFKNYGPGEGLRDHVVFYLQLDPEGRVWAATMNGTLYYVEKEKIIPFSQNSTITGDNQKAAFLTDFFIDQEGNKYLSLRERGILFFSLKGDFKVLSPLMQGIRKFAILVDNRWIRGDIKDAGKIKKSSFKDPNLPNVSSLIEIRADSIFYLEDFSLEKGSSAHWMKQINSNQFIRLQNFTLGLIDDYKTVWTRDLEFNSELKAVVEDTSGQWFMGLQRGGGLRKYQHLEDVRFGLYQQLLDGISISSVIKDSREGYWISTLENGVFYCSNLEHKIYDISSGLPSDHVVAIEIKNADELFIGFRNGSVVELNIINNQISLLPSSQEDIIYDLLWDAAREELWMTDGLLNLLEAGQWNPTFLPKESGGQFTKTSISKKMSLGKDGSTIWGTQYKGFGSFDMEKKTFVGGLIPSDHPLRTFRVIEDRQNRVWVASANGLYEFKNDTLIRPEPFDTILSYRIEDIVEMANGTLVLATKGAGVLFWDQKKVRQLTSRDGLTSDMIEGIHVDTKGRIWASTLAGLNKISLNGNDLIVESYTIQNGLPSNEITSIDSNGDQVWIGTNRGLVRWEETEKKEFSPIPILEFVRVGNEILNFSEIEHLNHKQNDIQFNYSTINYRMNGKIPYRYRLNEGHWSHTFSRSVNFSEFAPGIYTFEIQSQNESGVWSESGSVTFSIHPPFWQTGWFTVLWICFLSAVGWWYFRSRIEQVGQKIKIEQEMNELRSAALRAQMNPHFIFNCLNSIQDFISKNDKANAAHYLGRFAQLVRRALNASREQMISLEDEITLLKDYLSLEQLRFKEKFNYHIQISDQLNLFETELPPMIIQPFVENAIIHGMAGKTSGGMIILRFLKAVDALVIEIEDNGQGRNIKQSILKNNKLHRSVGMQIPRDRLKLANDDNQMEVLDLYDEEGQKKGTLIRLILVQ